MPTYADFTLGIYEDGNITMGLQPPGPIGGKSIEFAMMKRPGGSGIVLKSCASGFVNVSGINILNSGTGIISINLFQSEISGQEAGNYFYQIRETTSGHRTVISEGFRRAT